MTIAMSSERNSFVFFIKSSILAIILIFAYKDNNIFLKRKYNVTKKSLLFVTKLDFHRYIDRNQQKEYEQVDIDIYPHP